VSIEKFCTDTAATLAARMVVDLEDRIAKEILRAMVDTHADAWRDETAQLQDENKYLIEENARLTKAQADLTMLAAQQRARLVQITNDPGFDAGNKVLEALSEIVSPEEGNLWEHIAASFGAPSKDRFNKPLREFINAVEDYRSALWPYEFPQDGEHVPMSHDERQAHRADIAYDDLRSEAA